MRTAAWLISRNMTRWLLIAVLTTPASVLSAQVWEVENQLLQLATEQGDAYFGYSVAVGDFNGDGIEDLAVGAPGWDSAVAADAGRVEVYWGSGSRSLTSAGSFSEVTNDDSNTGYALAAGDFDGDGQDELAVGEPKADVTYSTEFGVGTQPDLGQVRVFKFVSGAFGEQVLIQPPPDSIFNIIGATAHSQFGHQLAVGDFDGDQHADLAVAMDFTYCSFLPPCTSGGEVLVFYGSSSGLAVGSADTITSADATDGDDFGSAMAAGDFDGDGYDDLAIGAPARTIDVYANAGAVEIYSGSASGIVTSSPQLLEDWAFPDGTLDADQKFGFALASGYFNDSILCHLSHCYSDLAIGVPGQNIGSATSAGKVMVVYGSSTGIDLFQDTEIDESSVGLTPEDYDYFGWSLAAGSLDSSPYRLPEDLAIGTPFREVYTTNSDGMVSLVFSNGSGINGGQPAQSFGEKPGFAIAPAVLTDQFGTALAVGDLDGDGHGDLVVGVPYKADLSDSNRDKSGVVEVLYGALFADGFESDSTGNWSATSP